MKRISLLFIILSLTFLHTEGIFGQVVVKDTVVISSTASMAKLGIPAVLQSLRIDALNFLMITGGTITLTIDECNASPDDFTIDFFMVEPDSVLIFADACANMGASWTSPEFAPTDTLVFRYLRHYVNPPFDEWRGGHSHYDFLSWDDTLFIFMTV